MQFDALLGLWAATASTFLFLLFLGALFHKASDLVRFTGFLDNYNVFPQAILTVSAYGLIMTEALITVLLLPPQFNQFGAALAIGLLLIYATVIALNVAKGNIQIECGCGGPAIHLSYALVLRNVAIATMTLPLILAEHNPISLTDTAVATVCGAILYLLYVATAQLSSNLNRFHSEGFFSELS